MWAWMVLFISCSFTACWIVTPKYGDELVCPPQATGSDGQSLAPNVYLGLSMPIIATFWSWVGLWAGRASAAFAFLLAAFGFWKLMDQAWGSTLGRRFEAKAKLRRLAAGVRPQFFVDILGQPAFQRSTPPTINRTWVHPLYYVDATTDSSDETVRSYSVTITRRDFRPRVPWSSSQGPKAKVLRLGRATFEEFGTPRGIKGWLGARRMSYIETFYFGNPGNYQSYSVSINDAGADFGNPRLLTAVVGHDRPLQGQELSDAEVSAYLASQVGHELRHGLAPNTFTVTAPHVPVDMDGRWLGADHDTVRVASRPLPWRYRRRQRRRLDRLMAAANDTGPDI